MSDLLYDFETKGGICESVAVLKRTSKYTERFCKFTMEEEVFYSKLRVYSDGIAHICILQVEEEEMWMSDSVMIEKKTCLPEKMWLNRKRRLENAERREILQALYFLTFLAAIIITMGVIVLTIFRIIGIVEGAIYMALLVVYFILQRKIWHRKIIEIGHDEVNYYEIYK